jgi:subtilisin family serine protease
LPKHIAMRIAGLLAVSVVVAGASAGVTPTKAPPRTAGGAAAAAQRPSHAHPQSARPHRPAAVHARVAHAKHATATTPATTAAAPNDPLWAEEWGPRAVGLLSVWATAAAARNVVVAVVDTGVDATQRDLAGLVLPGWNALTGTADTADDNGHGTAVAGVIAARAGNGIGAAGYCRNCTILPVKVLDSSGHGPSTTIAAGIDWAVDHGANVLNLSLTLTSRDGAVSAAVARALAAGVIVVAAAGNTGGTGVAYPAAEPGVVSVEADDQSGVLYPWSTSGAWVSVAAPGCNQSTARGGGFGEFCGTSSAAAAVSGILGTVLGSSGATTARVRQLLPAGVDQATRRLDARALVSALAAAT